MDIFVRNLGKAEESLKMFWKSVPCSADWDVFHKQSVCIKLLLATVTSHDQSYFSCPINFSFYIIL